MIYRYHCAALIVFASFALESFIDSTVSCGVLDGLNLSDVFDLNGMHDLDVVAEVVQVVDRLILGTRPERVTLRSVWLLLLILRGEVVLGCQPPLSRVQRDISRVVP